VAGRTDIVVVGAGVIGCAIAYELSRRGAAVRVLDDRAPGMGATQASAGVLAPYIEADAGSPLLALTARSLDLFDEFVAGVQEVSGLAIAYRRTGTLDVALQEETMRRLVARAQMLSGQGVSVEVLDAPAARTEEPHLTNDVVGGLLIPAHGFVVAAELTQALVNASRKQGALFEQVSRVHRVSSVDGGLSVETPSGTLRADRVVIAAGSWAGQIEIGGLPVRPPVRPVRGQLLQLGWTGAPLRRATWSDRCYVVPWADGSLLVGATVEEAGFDERTTVAGVRDLIETVCELLPHAWTASLRAARAGLRPCTPDEVPIIGRSCRVPDVMYATGHYRNGVLLSPLTAHLAADALLDDRLDPMLALTSPQRFGEL
jgi:glycine oxidase